MEGYQQEKGGLRPGKLGWDGLVAVAAIVILVGFGAVLVLRHQAEEREYRAAVERVTREAAYEVRSGSEDEAPAAVEAAMKAARAAAGVE
jgi:hypothetical protein